VQGSVAGLPRSGIKLDLHWSKEQVLLWRIFATGARRGKQVLHGFEDVFQHFIADQSGENVWLCSEIRHSISDLVHLLYLVGPGRLCVSTGLLSLRLKILSCHVTAGPTPACCCSPVHRPSKWSCVAFQGRGTQRQHQRTPQTQETQATLRSQIVIAISFGGMGWFEQAATHGCRQT
jgi:hypothetical protein